MVAPEAEADTAMTQRVVDDDDPVMVLDLFGALGRGAGGVEVGRAVGEEACGEGCEGDWATRVEMRRVGREGGLVEATW